MIFLTLLFQHKEFIVILLLLSFIGVGWVYVKELHAKVGELQANNAALTTELTASNNSIKTLQSDINLQNSAIDKMKADADARIQSHQVEIAAANAKAETYRQQAMDILKMKSTGPDKCTNANSLINLQILKGKTK